MNVDSPREVELATQLLEEFKSKSHSWRYSGAEFTAWKNKVIDLIRRVYGSDSREEEDFRSELSLGLPSSGSRGDPFSEQRRLQDNFAELLPRIRGYMEARVQDLTQRLSFAPSSELPHQRETLNDKPPAAFIAHGGECQALTKLRDYLNDLGVEPLVVEKVASESRSVNEQVEHNLAQADCSIVLGTADDKNLRDGKLYPRDNVEIEIGRFQERFPERTIYLLEEGGSFSSNISEKVYERFTQDNMEKAFAKVARELTAFGILKSVKPAEKKANA